MHGSGLSSALFFGTMRLDAVSTFGIDRYRKQRLGTGAAPATINRELSTLSHLFSMAVEWKWLDRRPCKAKKTKEEGGRIIALDNGQCDALMRAAAASADSDCWLFVAFGLNTAMRHSEILGARFDQLDFDKRRLFIPDAKAGQRVQPITFELAEILERERSMRDDCGRPRGGGACGLEKPHRCLVHGRAGWVFPSPHGDTKTGHRARMDGPFREAVTAAGLDPELVTPHVMRHTGITALIEAGVDLPTVQRISGHKTLAMVLRYFHAHAPHINRAIKAIGRGLPAEDAKAGAATPEPGSEQEPQPNAATQELHGAPKLRAG
jgi:integrase